MCGIALLFNDQLLQVRTQLPSETQINYLRMIKAHMAQKKTVLTVALLILVLLPALFIRLRLLDFPLERDEGEYAYAGQLMLQGIAPYTLAYNMKWPGVYAAYALIMAVFGQSAAGIHLGVALVSFATAVLLFMIARRIADSTAGIVAAGTYSLLSISTGTLGLAGHATHFVILPVLGGIFLLMEADSRTPAWKFLSAGLLLGIATLMKQHGAVFGVFCAAWLVWHKYGRTSIRHAGLLILGGMIPLILTGVLLIAAGAFEKFWLWTFTYAKEYASIVSLNQGVTLFCFAVAKLVTSSPGLWCLVFLGAVMLFRAPSLRPYRKFMIAFTAVSFFAVCPGFYFRPHYFIVLLPAAGLLAGMTATGLSELKSTLVRPAFMTGLLFSVAAAGSLWTERDIFFRMSPYQTCRTVYGVNPFPESIEIAKYIDQYCPKDAQVVVFGSEPQIYFYSRRRSATGYIYMYPMMESQPLAARMQTEMIHEVEAVQPHYIVFVSVSTSWMRSTSSHPLLFNWLNDYLSKLKLVGFVEILPEGASYLWDTPTNVSLKKLINAANTDCWIAVFENPTTTQ